LALLHLPQKRVCAGFGEKRLTSSKYSSLASRQTALAEDDDRRFARWLPFHFGRETQCLQHSSCPQRPKISRRAGDAAVSWAYWQ